MDGNRTFLAELFFRFVYLSDEVYEPFSRLGHALFRPVSELKLPDGPRPVVNCISYLEFSKYVLRHVVFRDWFDNKRVVPHWSFGRPILVAFFLWKKCKNKFHVNRVGTTHGNVGYLTLPISWSLVSITTIVELCSHSMRQKSSVVICSGPWVAM